MPCTVAHCTSYNLLNCYIHEIKSEFPCSVMYTIALGAPGGQTLDSVKHNYCLNIFTPPAKANVCLVLPYLRGYSLVYNL